MLKKDYTAEFLNLENGIITNFENILNQLHISIELRCRKHVCPCCGAITGRVHDYRMQIVADAKDTFLHLLSIATVVTVVNSSLKRTPFFLDIAELQPTLWQKSFLPLKKLYPPKNWLPVQYTRRDSYAPFSML